MNDDTIQVPDHLQVFGAEALRLHELLADGLAMDAPPEEALGGPLRRATVVAMQRMERDILALTKVVNGPLQVALASPDGDVAAIYRVTGRMEDVLLRLVDSCRATTHVWVDAGEEYPKHLLVQTLRDITQRVAAFLERISEAIEDPEASSVQQTARGDGVIELSFQLTLDAPPELDELGQYWRDTQSVDEAASHDDSFMNTAVAVAIGALLGSSLFGGNCN